ncbi:MAG: DUF2066 domain-containing protein [Gammaproteobacteria bacterium]|nr:DUF2066 domain-containing protein [Gammaproteobacteria bacterium]
MSITTFGVVLTFLFVLGLSTVHAQATGAQEPDPAATGSSPISPARNVVEVAINGRTAEEESSAYGVGLRIVLLRYSNRTNPLPQDAIRRAVADATAYVQDQHLRVPGGSDRITRQTPLTPRVRETAEATHLLSIRYSLDAINQFIASQMDEETLPSENTVTSNSALVWLLVEDGNRKLIVGGGTGSNVMERAREIGGGVGQQLVFPILDEQDRQALSVQDILEGNQQKIAAASARYREPVVLTGILNRSRGRNWTNSWSRYDNGTIADTSGEANSLDQALQQGIRWLAGVEATGAAQGGFASASKDEGLIWVSDVDTVAGYSQLMAMIDNVEGALVYLKGLSAGNIQIAVTPRSAVGDVARLLLNNKRVQSAAVTPATGGQRPDAVLRYLR